MDSIIVNSPRTIRQYQEACKADAARERGAAEKPDPLARLKHNTEFVGCIICIPPQLVGIRLDAQDLRLLKC